MPDHYWLSEPPIERINPYFPQPHARPRVDYRRVISGNIHVTGKALCNARTQQIMHMNETYRFIILGHKQCRHLDFIQHRNSGACQG